jgi:hypothetical protein
VERHTVAKEPACWTGKYSFRMVPDTVSIEENNTQYGISLLGKISVADP